MHNFVSLDGKVFRTCHGLDQCQSLALLSQSHIKHENCKSFLLTMQTTFKSPQIIQPLVIFLSSCADFASYGLNKQQALKYMYSSSIANPLMDVSNHVFHFLRCVSGIICRVSLSTAKRFEVIFAVNFSFTFDFALSWVAEIEIFYFTWCEIRRFSLHNSFIQFTFFVDFFW